MINKKKPKDVFDSLIWLAFVICLILAVVSHNDKWYNFTIDKFVIVKIDDQGRSFQVSYNFTAPVFAVNQDIEADIMIRPSNTYFLNFPDEASKIDTVYLYFTGVTSELDVYVDGIKRSPTLYMTKEPDGKFYGKFKLKYQEEGKKCFTMDVKMLDGLRTYCEPDEEPMLIISPHDSTLQYQTNKIFMSLTLVVVGLSIISTRDQLRVILRISRE